MISAMTASAARKIRELRLRLEWSQDRLAYEADVSSNLIGRIECYDHIPKYTTQLKIAMALKVRRSELWGDPEPDGENP